MCYVSVMACETSLFNGSDFKEISWDVPSESTRLSNASTTAEEQTAPEKKHRESRKSVRIDDDIVIVYPNDLVVTEQPTVAQLEPLPAKR